MEIQSAFFFFWQSLLYVFSRFSVIILNLLKCQWIFKIKICYQIKSQEKLKVCNKDSINFKGHWYKDYISAFMEYFKLWATHEQAHSLHSWGLRDTDFIYQNSNMETKHCLLHK